MKKPSLYCLAAILILVIAFSGCDGGGGGGKASFSIAESLVPGATAFPTASNPFDYDGVVDDSGICTTVNYPYYIAKYKVSYALWKEVYDWSQSHGYSFDIEGKPGGGWDVNGTESNDIIFFDGHESDPVTFMGWADAVIWCNALTEYYNEKNHQSLECVYKDLEGNVIRFYTESIVDYLVNLEDFNRSAKGFRLPTSDEWELAARYLGPVQPSEEPLKTDSKLLGGLYWTPGNYASGATDGCNNATATQAAAWYKDNSRDYSYEEAYVTQPVGQKPANGNALGIYDMSGNVIEWCFDKIGEGRVARGGSFADEAKHLQLGLVGGGPLDETWIFFGFRPVRTK